MKFVAAKARLVEYVLARLRNGEITERGLATRVGLSQSHIHNVLKGKRDLSEDAADRILGGIGLTILDLYTRDEIVSYLSRRSAEAEFQSSAGARA